MYVPAGHMRQVADVDAPNAPLYIPGKHEVQGGAEKPRRVLYVPAEHTTHTLEEVAPLKVAYCPYVQLTHTAEVDAPRVLL